MARARSVTRLVAAALAAAALVPPAASMWCMPGKHYCGRTLLNTGDYQEAIDDALLPFRYTRCLGSARDTDDFLFLCAGGYPVLLGACTAGCRARGVLVNDVCKADWNATRRCDPIGGAGKGPWSWQLLE